MKTKNYLNYILVFLMIIILVFIVILLTKKTNVADTYTIKLLGDRYITLNDGEIYNEPGYNAYKNDVDVTNEVVVKNEINYNIPGLYKVTYSIDKYYEYRVIEIKPPIDYNLEIKLEPSIKTITNRDIRIDVEVVGSEFISLTLPDNTVVKYTLSSFIVNENGTYKVQATNSKNEIFEKEIIIDNIDKVDPYGTCSAILNMNNTIITVTTDDNISLYRYYDNKQLVNSSTNKTYTINTKTSNDISVLLEDEASNKKNITCSITDNRYYEQIKPNSNDNIIYHGNSDTLKTYIVNRNSYYLTYIWVKNPYLQLNKYDSPEYGRILYTPRKLLEKAIPQKGLQGKIIVAFNASGFYLRDYYDIDSVNAYPAYNMTSVGTLVITDGKVVRNAYDHAVKTWFTVGVDPNNQLRVFEDSKSSNKEEKKKWADGVIASGIRNTFTFAAPLIQNGQRTNLRTSMPGGYDDAKGLQIICQINDNNFLLFSSKNDTRNTAINEFLRLGCKTATNLDGGGSVSLLYKDKNTTEINAVVGGGRQLPEVAYFTE